MDSVIHRTRRVIQNPLRDGCIAFILASAVFTAPSFASEPPPNLARRVADREAAAAAARDHYTYRQTFLLEEVPERRTKPTLYREVRDIIFSPSGEKSLQLVEPVTNSLQRLRLTDEDFRDIYEVQSLLFVPDLMPVYQATPKGEENMDGIDCWVLQVRPRQIFSGQRLFEGMFWVDKRDYSIIRSEGRPVPQLRSKMAGKENLFPAFTTLREKVGDHWFPIYTHADETLDFSTGPIRVKMSIRYRDYKRFATESKVLP
jgi:hypothetical protein